MSVWNENFNGVLLSWLLSLSETCSIRLTVSLSTGHRAYVWFEEHRKDVDLPAQSTDLNPV